MTLASAISHASELANKRQLPIIVYRSTRVRNVIVNGPYYWTFTLPMFAERVAIVRTLPNGDTVTEFEIN